MASLFKRLVPALVAAWLVAGCAGAVDGSAAPERVGRALSWNMYAAAAKAAAARKRTAPLHGILTLCGRTAWTGTCAGSFFVSPASRKRLVTISSMASMTSRAVWYLATGCFAMSRCTRATTLSGVSGAADLSGLGGSLTTRWTRAAVESARKGGLPARSM